MSRKYELKRRAERQRETRRRIVDAAIELHTSVGPARTTISAVAERAGVQRHTVYRHFPTEDDLFAACTTDWDARHPFPKPGGRQLAADPQARLHGALSEVYDYYRSVEEDLALFHRDAATVPSVGRTLAEDARQRTRLRDRLAAGWGARGRRRTLLVAAIGHALEFDAWRSLARQGIDDDAAAELMTRLAVAAAGAQRRTPARRQPAASGRTSP